ncbi:MAG: hypothetical protein WCF04_05550 [Candidatus Nanopelagicales bacterium]
MSATRTGPATRALGSGSDGPGASQQGGSEPLVPGEPRDRRLRVRGPSGPGSRRSRAKPRERARAPRHRLLLASVAVLAAGLVGVLLLNTIISQGAFRQHSLEIELILLAEEEERLAREAQLADSPLELEKKARALDMVPAGSPVFLRLSDGKILGEPVAAPAPTGKVSFAGAPGIKASPTPSAPASGAAQTGFGWTNDFPMIPKGAAASAAAFAPGPDAQAAPTSPADEPTATPQGTQAPASVTPTPPAAATSSAAPARTGGRR